VLVADVPARADGLATDTVTLQWATFIAATIAAVGSVVRVAQNERAYRLMRKMYKRAKKK
jgi:hypothetical protein